MKYILIFIFFIVTIICKSQNANISYSVQLVEANVDTLHSIFEKSNTFLNNEQKQKLVSSFINYLYRQDTVVTTPLYFSPDYAINNILKDSLSSDNENTIYFKKDSAIFIIDPVWPEFFINQKGEFAADTIMIEDPETGEYSAKVVFNSDLYSKFGGIVFEENWRYRDGKFEKEIIKNGVVTYTYNPEYSERVLKRNLGMIESKNNKQNNQLLAKDLCYDIRIVPVLNREDDYNYDETSSICYYKNSFEKNMILINVLNDISAGKIKAYKVVNNSIDKTKELDYKTVKEILSKTEITLPYTDLKKLHKYQEQKPHPIVVKKEKYKKSFLGNIEYPEYNNYMPIVVGITSDTVGYDTTWVFKKDYVIQKIIFDTLYNYKLDKSGNPIVEYDENGNSVYQKEIILAIDTIQVLKPEYQAKINKDCDNIIKYFVEHDQINNITNIRFYEDWYFNPESFSITKKVKGIGLFVTYFNDPEKVFGNDFYFDSESYSLQNRELKLYIEFN